MAKLTTNKINMTKIKNYSNNYGKLNMIKLEIIKLTMSK